MKGLAFNETMIKAWMAGNKTVTRRPVKFNLSGRVERAGKQWHIEDPNAYLATPYLPGETVYIKETWCMANGIRYYRADHPVCEPERWGSPISMPECAARSHARIVSVRLERVQEITEEEAICEGFAMTEIGVSARTCFRITWNAIYPGSWERNDWEWRIELEKL